MKALFATLLILSIASASNFLEVQNGIEAQEGHQCIPNPTFNVTSFDVQPWPPVLSGSLTMNMTGVFVSSAYVENLSVGTNYNRQQWNYQHRNINTNFTKGQTYSFIIQTDSGQRSGQYIKEVVLSNQDHNNNYVHLACWQFLYTLS